MLSRVTSLVVLCVLPYFATAADRPDIVFADFEGSDYGQWTATGTAFGTGPAKGTLPGQMAVTGFQGKGLVNSFAGGDKSTGTLTSPEFVVERKHLNFLIGGGGHAGKTCMNLVIEGKVVRTVTGPNTAPGGSEELAADGWDVTEYAGKKAKLVVVDTATGGWGHINVDQIVFSDAKPEKPVREIAVQKRYLHFPVKNRGTVRHVKVFLGDEIVREFTIELADGPPDWWAPLDVSAWQGKTLRVQANSLPAKSQGLATISQDDAVKGENLYAEKLRPQLHVSPRRGWNNDPNGMVYADGEWHLYFQHNPYGTEWGNMHWGHWVSKDLARWEEVSVAVYPKKFGDWAFSGSAIVDHANTSGWKTGPNELLVGAYTSTGRGECMIYSNDKGRTWTEFAGNPVVKHAGRDPKLLWHTPSKQWVMAVYDEADKKQWIAFHTSPDLKAWTYRSRIEGYFECPDLFELPVDGDGKNRKWVLTAANSDYQVGTFDGATFTPETKKIKGVRGKGFYAAQTFANAPDGRVIQVGWLQAPSPGMAFNQAMSIPLELKLMQTADGPRLSWSPVKELDSLAAKTTRVGAAELKPGDDPLKDLHAELLKLNLELTPSDAAVVELKVRGVPIRYDAKKQELDANGHKVAAPLRGGKLRLTVLADRTSYEIFAADGLAYVPIPVIPKAEDKSLSLTVTGGTAKLESGDVGELKSIWSK
ncbi:glycoside hydrolase family 32 protein [Limnoglobus roseus]|uniref:GH32b + CBM38-retaining endo-levanase or other beta-fructosidase n=1 Tax=Limnoglobus roseus TaxID=2598579 RepID=A0A5C1AJS9_9BACT|nr:glycoside hydrolase family 32 protein [Limnoglobus roseus]QEL18935.1 GH32b + CBM38 - retaining endo-levanase or other beta-fructosidase [Limnoglobus roseus]